MGFAAKTAQPILLHLSAKLGPQGVDRREAAAGLHVPEGPAVARFEPLRDRADPVAQPILLHLSAKLGPQGVDRREAAAGLHVPEGPAVARFEPLRDRADQSGRAPV